MWYVNYFPNDSSLVKSNRNKIIRKEFDGDYRLFLENLELVRLRLGILLI